jgi:hypothetical protein
MALSATVLKVFHYAKNTVVKIVIVHIVMAALW